MRQLIPEPDAAGEPDLSVIYAYPPGARRWVRANMVSSADGAAQQDGLSGGLSGAADEQVFHVLRALADVILVGAGTVRGEGYGPAASATGAFADARAAAGQRSAAAIAVVSAGLDLDFGSPLYVEAAVPTITVTVTDAPAERLAEARAAGDVVIAGSGRVDLALAVDGLMSRGLRRILCEGGPRLLGALTAQGLLDELCLSLSPKLLAGDAVRVLNGPAPTAPVNLAIGSMLTEEDFVFLRYRVIAEDAA